MAQPELLRTRRWSLNSMTALVTGGTKGIGHAIVEDLASFGAAVYTCARNKELLDECLAKWKSKGYIVEGSVCDLLSQAQREVLMESVSRHFSGKINILVNNVGTSTMKEATEYTTEDYSRIMGTNLESAFHLCQLAHPLLKASRNGSIVMISSVGGHLGIPSNSIYSMSKGALNQLAKNLACEWANDNIRVNSVSPWVTITPLLDCLSVRLSPLAYSLHFTLNCIKPFEKLHRLVVHTVSVYGLSLFSLIKVIMFHATFYKNRGVMHLNRLLELATILCKDVEWVVQDYNQGEFAIM